MHIQPESGLIKSKENVSIHKEVDLLVKRLCVKTKDINTFLFYFPVCDVHSELLLTFDNSSNSVVSHTFSYQEYNNKKL